MKTLKASRNKILILMHKMYRNPYDCEDEKINGRLHLA